MKNKKFYELIDLTVNEVLADNLEFDELPELFEAYGNFTKHNIIAIERIDDSTTTKVLSPKQEYTKQWLDLVQANVSNFY